MGRGEAGGTGGLRLYLQLAMCLSQCSDAMKRYYDPATLIKENTIWNWLKI